MLRHAARISSSVGLPTQPHFLRAARRMAYTTRITDPPRNGGTIPSMKVAHPKDPGNQTSSAALNNSAQASSSTHPPQNSPPPPAEGSEPPPLDSSSSLPVLASPPPLDPPYTKLPDPASQQHLRHYAYQPFHTHRFVVELEKSFPSPTARSLMRAIRALLVDRVGKVKRDALTMKDLESVRPALFILSVYYTNTFDPLASILVQGRLVRAAH